VHGTYDSTNSFAFFHGFHVVMYVHIMSKCGDAYDVGKPSLLLHYWEREQCFISRDLLYIEVVVGAKLDVPL